MVNMENLIIRRAKPNDAPQLYLWDKEPHVMAATSNSGTQSFDADWDDELAPRNDGTEFYIAEVNNKPIGAMQIINPHTERSHYWGAIANNLRAIDIWIGDTDYLAKGYGSRMMTMAINRCFSNPVVSAILIDPLTKNTRSHVFYQRLGFEFLERRQFDEESDCHVYKLTRLRWEATPKL